MPTRTLNYPRCQPSWPQHRTDTRSATRAGRDDRTLCVVSPRRSAARYVAYVPYTPTQRNAYPVRSGDRHAAVLFPAWAVRLLGAPEPRCGAVAASGCAFEQQGAARPEVRGSVNSLLAMTKVSPTERWKSGDVDGTAWVFHPNAEMPDERAGKDLGCRPYMQHPACRW